MKARMLAVVLCLITVAAFGQSNPKLKELEPFAGSFQCTGTSFASPLGPEHPTKGTLSGHWVLGGAWLQIRYSEMKTAKNPHPYDVIAMCGYDEQPKALVSVSADDMGGYGTSQSQGWDGDKLVFSGPMHGGGMSATGRDTFTRVGRNEIIHEGEMDQNGTWIKLDREVCKK